MAEYIEREALLKVINTRLKHLRDAYGDYDHYTDGYDECVDRVEDFPTADVVEVVRCKDCIHLNKERMLCTNDKIRLFNIGHPTFSNHFCSYGERKPMETVSLANKSNKCVSCGTDIPEGTWTCPICDKRWE